VNVPVRTFAVSKKKGRRIPAGRIHQRMQEEKKVEYDETTIKAAVLRSEKRVTKRWPGISEIWRKKPTSPGLRHARFLDKKLLWSGKPFKQLTFGLRKSGGRNNIGRISIRFRGGGAKRKYRIIDFRREIQDQPGKVVRLEYDPNRSAHIALVYFEDRREGDRFRYIIATKDMEPGNTIAASRLMPPPITSGNAMPLKFIPAGTLVSCLELQPGRGAQVARSAGTFARLTGKKAKKGYVNVKMCSGEERLIHGDCMATVGVVSNPNHQFVQIGKAGRNRNLGWRPRVRGVAMNPVDHPMGGGEARSKSGRPSCSKWGWPTKGRRTRDPKKKDWRILVRRYNTEEYRLERALRKRNTDGMETPQKVKRKAAAKAKLLAMKQEMKAQARSAAVASRQAAAKAANPGKEAPKKKSRAK
jgi:large subunit ribosomal protein L2